MKNIIRKISVGKDYPDGVLHYQLKNKVRLPNGEYEITDILLNMDLLKLSIVGYDIFISNNNGKILWKTISGVPVVIENDVNFE